MKKIEIPRKQCRRWFHRRLILKRISLMFLKKSFHAIIVLQVRFAESFCSVITAICGLNNCNLNVNPIFLASENSPTNMQNFGKWNRREAKRGSYLMWIVIYERKKSIWIDSLICASRDGKIILNCTRISTCNMWYLCWVSLWFFLIHIIDDERFYGTILSKLVDSLLM